MRDFQMGNKQINILFFTVSKLHVPLMRSSIKSIDNLNFFVTLRPVGTEMCGLCPLIRRDQIWVGQNRMIDFEFWGQRFL